MREEKPNLKRDDALELLRLVASGAPEPARPALRFEENFFCREMVDHLLARSPAAAAAG